MGFAYNSGVDDQIAGERAPRALSDATRGANVRTSEHRSTSISEPARPLDGAERTTRELRAHRSARAGRTPYLLAEFDPFTRPRRAQYRVVAVGQRPEPRGSTR